MHFLQSPAWQKFQDNLERQTFRQSGDGWEYLAILEHGKANSRLYCPYGPYAKDLAAFEEAIDSLTKLGRKHNVTFLRIEPTKASRKDWLKQHMWHRVTYQSLNPEHTSLINLSQPEDEIIAQMSQPARNIYRNYQKKGLKVEVSSNPGDVDIFLKLIHQVAERTGMRPHSDSYFKTQADALFPVEAAKLWHVTYQGQPIAAAILYDSNTTRYYAHAATDDQPELRKLNAGTALVSEAIIDAQRKGLQFFDLNGVAPDNSPKDHPWYGFTRFKRSFGGQNKEFAGSWDLPLRPLAYWAYRTYQTIRK